MGVRRRSSQGDPELETGPTEGGGSAPSRGRWKLAHRQIPHGALALDARVTDLPISCGASEPRGREVRLERGESGRRMWRSWVGNVGGARASALANLNLFSRKKGAKAGKAKGEGAEFAQGRAPVMGPLRPRRGQAVTRAPPRPFSRDISRRGGRGRLLRARRAPGGLPQHPAPSRVPPPGCVLQGSARWSSARRR